MSNEVLFKFTKCPICGGEEMVGQKVLGKDKRGLEATIHPLANPTLVVPILVVYYDICATCGTRYCVRVEKGSGMVGPPPKLPNLS